MIQPSRKYNLIKAVSAYTISSFLINGISFFVLPLFTRLLTTEEYGVFGLYSSYFSIYEIIIVFGGLSTIKMAKFTDEIDYDSYVSTMFIVPVIFTVLFCFIINIIFIFREEVLSLNRTIWNFLFITGLFASISSIICSKLAVDGNYKEKIIYSAIFVFINIGLSLLICYSSFFKNEKYMSRIIGAFIANIIAFGYVIFRIRIKKINIDCLKLFIKWSTPLFFHTIATILIIQSDKLVLKTLKDFSAVGVYTIAATLASIPMTIQASVDSSWSPWFLRKLYLKDYSTIYLVNNFCMVVFGFLIFFFILISPDIIHIFTSKDYWGAINILAPLSITVYAEMLYCFPVNLEFYNKKTLYVCVGTIIALILNIVLDFAFVSFFDIQGAAYATALSRFILFLLHYLISKRIDNNKIINLSTAILICIWLFGINIFTIYFQDKLIIRYGIFVIFSCLFALYFRKNRQILKLMRGNDE